MNTPACETEPVDRIQKKFDDQEKSFQRTVKCQETLRAFFAKYRDVIAPFTWRAWGWCDTEIVFEEYNIHEKAKVIAAAFGKDGWTREADRYSCGSINWHKALDGCELIIKGAERISPKLVEHVKL